jgi:2'-5' RNA ligase
MSIEDQYGQTIAIVYPAVAPADEYNLPLEKEIQTHVTISLLGEIPEVDFGKEELVAALRNIEWEEITEAQVDQLDMFGTSKDFLVMRLSAPELQANWNSVNDALADAGIPSLNKFPDYRPHITLRENYDGSLSSLADLPDTVKLGLPTLWWGTEAIPLNFQN